MRKLTEELLDQIKARIVKAIKPDIIYLFGSYAMGQPDEDSDLDLHRNIERRTPNFEVPNWTFDVGYSCWSSRPYVPG